MPGGEPARGGRSGAAGGADAGPAGDPRFAGEPRLEAGERQRVQRPAPELKGSIGEGLNHSNFSDQSSHSILSKFRNFG